VGFQDPQQKGSFQRAEKSISSEETGLGDRAEMLEHLPGKRKPLSSNLKYFHKKEKKKKKEKAGCWWVAHACNPSYSGSREEEDCGSNSGPGK
jgi:hypothetical protein